MQGCVDLRHLVLRYHESMNATEAKKSSTFSLGLGALSLRFLGHTLDKDWQVRLSDWEAEDLTKRQVGRIILCKHALCLNSMLSIQSLSNPSFLNLALKLP